MSDDLIQWLRAQLDEDEQAARAAALTEGLTGSLVDFLKHEAAHVDVAPSEAHYARHTPARVLREIDAKRRIIEQHERYARERRRMMGGWDPQSDDSPILAALATVYADRPGYREEWRP
ncbi:DUF6221 family protein [Streptomyces sp. enrichment culture]|uniref:DUF6221 family protein n=1 Tax=Streptomyces sp. enrichment culture TaxID=1795815 RepID=UPI003F54AEF3